MTDFPFVPVELKVGFLEAVDCVAWMPFPLLSDHWLTALELWVTELESEASNHSFKFGNTSGKPLTSVPVAVAVSEIAESP